MKQATGIVKKEETHMTVADQQGSLIDQKDIQIPRILLAQNMSEIVTEGKAAIGDIYDSLSWEVLAKKGTVLEVVPLFHWKTWVLSEEVKGKFEFRTIVPWTPSNSDLPWNWTEKGTNWKRTQCLNFFVMTTASLKKEREIMAAVQTGKALPAVLEVAKPYMLSFQGMSYKSGKTLVDHFKTIQMFQARGTAVEVYRNIFKLTSATEKNDKGTYSIFQIENSKMLVTPEDQKICAQWQREIAINASRLKVDADEQQEAPQVTITDADVSSMQQNETF